MADKDNAASNKRKENLMRYNLSIISPDGQFSASNMTSSSMGRMSLNNAMWDKLPGTQHFGFNDIGVHHGTSMPNVVGTRPIDVGWTPPKTMLKGDIFVQDADDGFLHPSLAHIPTDSGFIERATRYSCFTGGNFGDIANPLSIPESAYLNMAGSSNCVGLLGECKGTRHKNDKASENMERSIDEPKLCGSDASNDSDEAEYSSPGGQDELKIADKGDSSKGVVASKKRKRFGQDAEMDQGRVVSDKLVEVVKDHTKLKQKGKQIPTSTCGKPGGENAKKYGPGASDKVEYVHVRAPRGQATNSHSLAERIRREKISERMKFLQDIVPGCSKVTGKAVMLDEIINYVQSLQLQIEFLSMKLATLNPRVDTNAERLVLTEDLLQSRGTPSSMAFPPIMSMGYPTLHQSQGIVQTGIQTLGSSWDVLRRSMNSSLTAMDGGYNKEHSSHVSSTWEDELHNVVHMGSSSTAPLSSQDISGSLPPGPMKAKP